MLTLDYLKKYRIAHDLSRPVMASVTGITLDRLREIELRELEPWFDEACAIARSLNLLSLEPLIASGYLTVSELVEKAGPATGHDHEAWLSGVRIPLSLALRVCLSVGLRDPMQLVSSALDRQVWAILSASERNPEGAGWCPWCAADVAGGSPHLPTCLPSTLWYAPPPGVKRAPHLLPLKARVGNGGVEAHGLRSVRSGLGRTQVEMANLMGVHPNYYSMLETGKRKLTYKRAKALADLIGVDTSQIFARPPEGM